MNIYDFDKTIFYPDSSVTFVKWSAKRHPLIFLRCLPIMAWRGLLYLLKLIPKERLKESAFRFIKYLPNLDEELKYTGMNTNRGFVRGIWKIGVPTILLSPPRRSLWLSP